MIFASLLLGGMVAAKPWSVAFEFSDSLKGWQEVHNPKNADVSLQRVQMPDGQWAADLSIPDDEKVIASLVRTINLPEDKGVVLEISGQYRTLELKGDVQAVIQPLGGSSPGNGNWQVNPLDTTDGQWRSFEMTCALPSDAKKISLRLMLVRGSGSLQLSGLRVTFLEASELDDNQVAELVLDDARPAGHVTPLHLGVNTAFWFPGLYYGTLPTHNPESHREAFIESLQQAGIRAVRFPGGTTSHFYLTEGKDVTDELLLSLDGVGNVSSAWPKGHYPRWEDYRETMREAGMAIIYQLNTSFYVDEKGKLRPICDSKFTKASGLADGEEHYEEAASALARLFDKGVFQPGDVDYWEIGNEEFAKMTVEQYARIVAAYTRVLKQYDPETPICYTGHWEIESLLEEEGVLDMLKGKTFHYPFSQWPGPQQPHNTAEYTSFAHTDMGITRSLDRFMAKVNSGELPAHLKRSISETGVYKYWKYDPFRMTCSFAHALAYANNWPQLMSHPIVDQAIYHELESPFFGQIMYHAEFHPVLREWEWLDPEVKPQVLDTDPEGGAKARQRIRKPEDFTSMPTTRVMAMLSQFEGADALLMKSTSAHALGQAMIGRDKGRFLLFLSSPDDYPVGVRMTWPEGWPQPESGSWRLLDADSVAAALDTEYREREIPAPLPVNGRLEVVLPPYSVSLFEWKVE